MSQAEETKPAQDLRQSASNKLLGCAACGDEFYSENPMAEYWEDQGGRKLEVYICNKCIRKKKSDDDTFRRCLKALGWQGGTIHQVLRVLNYTRILVESHDNALATGDWEEFKSKIEQLKLAFKA